MKTTLTKYGLYSALTIVILFILGWLLGKALDIGYTGQEIVGYTTIIISLSFVFFGIKHFRDQENDGKVTFGKALLIGLIISLCAALAFGLVDIVYQYLNPNFTIDYYNHHVAELNATLSGEALEIKLAEMEAQRDLFSSKTMSFLIMSMTVFIIGFIVSLLSALILQRK